MNLPGNLLCEIGRFCAFAAFVLAAVILSGCASTEELYADYDANCPVDLGQAKAGVAVVTDRVTRENMQWNPAIYFEFDEDKLNSVEQQKLAQNLRVLTKYPQLQIAVRGFTDSRGSNTYNHGLAMRRVATVSEYLANTGLESSRVKQVGLGEELPILDENNEATHAIHRRVELLLLDKQGRPLQTGIAIASRSGDVAAEKPASSAEKAAAVSPLVPAGLR